jgi:hypothetical protein
MFGGTENSGLHRTFTNILRERGDVGSQLCTIQQIATIAEIQFAVRCVLGV